MTYHFGMKHTRNISLHSESPQLCREDSNAAPNGRNVQDRKGRIRLATEAKEMHGLGLQLNEMMSLFLFNAENLEGAIMETLSLPVSRFSQPPLFQRILVQLRSVQPPHEPE